MIIQLFLKEGLMAKEELMFITIDQKDIQKINSVAWLM